MATKRCSGCNSRYETEFFDFCPTCGLSGNATVDDRTRQRYQASRSMMSSTQLQSDVARTVSPKTIRRIAKIGVLVIALAIIIPLVPRARDAVTDGYGGSRDRVEDMVDRVRSEIDDAGSTEVAATTAPASTGAAAVAGPAIVLAPTNARQKACAQRWNGSANAAVRTALGRQAAAIDELWARVQVVEAAVAASARAPRCAVVVAVRSADDPGALTPAFRFAELKAFNSTPGSFGAAPAVRVGAAWNATVDEGGVLTVG